MLPSILPLELTDIIIDHLHADRDALVACTLVCRAWRGAARHHLLATIFCPRGGLEQLLAQLEAQDGPSRVEDDATDNDNSGSRVVGGDGVSRTADEKGISKAFAPCVREVWVYGTDRLVTRVDVATLSRVLAALPNLHTLHLKYVSLVPPDDPRDTQGADALQVRYSLRWLDLAMVYQADTRLVVAMLGLFAKVQKLTLLDAFTAGTSDDDNPEEGQEKTRCESLDVNVNGRWSIPPRVRRVLGFDKLRALKMGRLRPENVAIVHEILRAAAGSLESLTLQLLPGDHRSVWAFMSTISWRALTRISLGVMILGGPEPFASVTSLLSYLPRTRISVVELELDAQFMALLGALGWDVGALGWGSLETQLLRFTHLRSFAIDRSDREGRRDREGRLDRERFLETVRRGMPTLAARGLLAGHLSAQ